MQEIDDAVVNNLLTSLIISLVLSIENQLPNHARKARALRKLYEALKEFGSLDSLEIPEEIAFAAAVMWNRLLVDLQEFLEQYDTKVSHEVQLELFQ